MKKSEIKIPSESWPIVFETYRQIGDWEVKTLKQDEPTCFNGIINYRRYRVTVELIEEPQATLIDRVKKLIRECDNHHHYRPLAVVARHLGFEIGFGEFGKNRKR